LAEQEQKPQFDRWSRPDALSWRGYALVVLVPIVIAAIAFGAIALFASEEPDVRGTTVFLPTSDWEPGNGGDGALFEGVLRMDQQHCIYLETGTGNTYAVWPAGWRATREGELLNLYDADGARVARDGDTISAGGGAHPVETYAGEPCLPEDGEVAVVQGEVSATQ